VENEESKCHTNCSIPLSLVLDVVKRIEVTQVQHTTRLNIIEAGIHNHLSTTAANTTSMASSLANMQSYLGNIEKTNSALVRNSRWSVPLVAVLLIISIFLFRELGDGGKAKFGDMLEIERGVQKKQNDLRDDNKTVE